MRGYKVYLLATAIFLAASALYCAAGTLGAALRGRDVEVRSLTGRAVIEQGPDKTGRMCVSHIRIEVEADLDEKDQKMFEKCCRIAEHACLVSYSLRNGVDVSPTFRRV